MRRCRCVLAPALGFAVLLAVASRTEAQNRIIVSGRVIEAGERAAVTGATVSIIGVGQQTTGGEGEFRIPRVPSGEHVLTVSALGYASRELRLSLRADTILIIELDREPVALEDINVRARFVTVRGTVRDGATLDPVLRARVTVDGTRSANTNMIGSFRVRQVPAGPTLPLVVRAIGYMPHEQAIEVGRDTTLRVDLQPDPVGQRMLAAQVERLSRRARGVPHRLDQWNRGELGRTPGMTIADLIRQRLGGNTRPATCLFIDDVDRSSVMTGLLNHHLVDEFERVEVLDRGSMVRLYTREHLAWMTGTEALPPIVLVKFGSRSAPLACR